MVEKQKELSKRVTEEDIKKASKMGFADALKTFGMKSFDVGADIAGGLSNVLNIGGQQGKAIRTAQDIQRAQDIGARTLAEQGKGTLISNLPKIEKKIINQEVKQVKEANKDYKKQGQTALKEYEKQLDAYINNSETRKQFDATTDWDAYKKNPCTLAHLG